jgi:hypothetical protein
MTLNFFEMENKRILRFTVKKKQFINDASELFKKKINSNNPQDNKV